MNDFDYENSQKKALARNAFHKKGGSKSRKCTMPSDYLTEAQKRKLNGPVTTGYLDKPMTWAQFKVLSDTLKVEYIKHLEETYGASGNDLTRMFGCAQSSVSREKKRLGFKAKPAGPKKSEHYAAWEEFLRGGESKENPAEATQEGTEDFLAHMEVPEGCAGLDCAEPEEKAEEPGKAGGATRLEVCFNGMPTMAQLEALWQMIGSKRARVKIEMEVV